MKPSLKNILTHAGAVLLGLGLMAALGGMAAGKRSADAEKRTAGGAGQAGGKDGWDLLQRKQANSGKERQPGNLVKRYRPEEYKAAWDAIGFRNLTVRDRIELQQKILAQWALVDMEGAMMAALGGPWDGHYQEGGIDALMSSFAEAFKLNPLGAWDLIQSGKLGPGSALFREQWAKTAGQHEPLLAVSVLGSFSRKDQSQVLRFALDGSPENRELRAQILAKLAELPPDTKDFSGLIAEAFGISPSDGDPASYREAIANASTDEARTMALHEYLSSLRNLDATALRNEWSQLPPDLQARAAVGLFNSPVGVKNAPDVLDLIMETGKWDRLKDPTAQNNLRNYARTLNGVDLASWGMKLPERPETIEIFRRAVDPYISRNIGDARGWIESLPQGWHRDRALGQFSQHALYGSKDPALSQWALDNISDPQIKAEATKWRGDWAKQTGYVTPQ